MFNKLLIVSGLLVIVNGFPNGAPADTCVRSRSNEPNHGASRSQSVNHLPFQVIASTDEYHPGSEISVTIMGGGENFRGFFLQARDAETNDWIGEFMESPNTNVIPECSSITHADPKDKSAATFIWHAPQHKRGRVYFTGAIVQNYGTWWSKIVAQIPVPQHQLHHHKK